MNDEPEYVLKSDFDKLLDLIEDILLFGLDWDTEQRLDILIQLRKQDQ